MRENLSAYCLWILPLLILFKEQQIFLFPSMHDSQKYQTLNNLDMSLHKIIVYCYVPVILYYLNIPINCSKKDFLGIPEIQK